MHDESNPDVSVDMSAIKAFCDTDEELRMFIDTFTQQAREDLAKLGQHCTEGENIPWSETAHKMKGGCATFGAFKMQKLCAEAQGMKIATLAERQALYNDLEKAFQEVLDYLAREYPAT